MAAIEGLQALALVRAALASPMLAGGGVVVFWFLASAVVLKLGLIPADPGPIGLSAALTGAVVATSVGRPRRGDVEGPFGWILPAVGPRGLVAARRTAPVLITGLGLFTALVVIARPDALTAWLPVAALGAILGGGAGVVVAAFLPQTNGDWKAPANLGRVRLNGPIFGVALAAGLILAAARLSAQDASAAAQLTATLAIAAAVIPTLAIDARRLTLRAQSPLPMTRLLLPGLIRPGLTAVISALAASAATGVSAPSAMALALALTLGLLVALSKLFLMLGALGRADRAAATAGRVELALAVLLPTAGPAAIGPLAILWLLFRLVWLWRRGGRVRWLDAGET